MRGVRLTTKKREHLLQVYWSEGFAAAEPLAILYGICPYHIHTISLKAGKSVKQTNAERARAAVTAMLAEFKVGREDLCRSRFAEHVKLRRIAVKRMRKMGLSQVLIAQALGVHESTVRYWAHGYRRWSKRTHSVVQHQSRLAKANEREGITT